MINYSVYMMGNPLKKGDPEKAYARNQVTETWTMDKFVKHIADHGGVYSRGTVKGVVSDTCDCLVEQLLNGNKVQLGELGTFSISISSEGAESLEKFTAKHIRAVNIVFTPGPEFENLVDKAEFNPVPSRVAQMATLKAEKAGMDTVDLAAAKATTGGSSSSGSGSSDGGGSDVDPDNPLG